MDFEEFWATLQIELGKERSYLTRTNETFFAQYYGNLIHISLSDGKPYQKISKEKMKEIWDLAKGLDDERRFVTTEYSVITRSASYILPLIDEFNDGEIE